MLKGFKEFDFSIIPGLLPIDNLPEYKSTEKNYTSYAPRKFKIYDFQTFYIKNFNKSAT